MIPVPEGVVRRWMSERGEAWREVRTLREQRDMARNEVDRLRARVAERASAIAELEAAGSVSPDDAHTTTETRTEWREVLINDERFSWSIPATGVAMARKHPAYRVESRTVSTTTRTTDWKAETP